MSEYQTFEADGFKVTSNTLTSEQIGESLASHKADPGAEPAPEADPNPEADPEATPERPPKAEKRPRDDPKARVAEATRNAAEAKKRIDEVQRRAEAAEAELRRIRETQAPPKPLEPPAGKPAESNGRPTLADFDSLDDHAEAVAKWVLKQERAEAEKAAKAESFERYKAQRVENFTTKMQAHLESDPEWWGRQNEAVVQLRPLSVMGPSEVAGPLNVLAEHFLSSANPVALIEYFSQNPEEVQRFSRMQSEAQFWLEVGKVESGLGSAAITASATVPQVSSKAAPPPRPVSGGPTTARISPEKESFEQYYARRAKEEEQRR